MQSLFCKLNVNDLDPKIKRRGVFKTREIIYTMHLWLFISHFDKFSIFFVNNLVTLLGWKKHSDPDTHN